VYLKINGISSTNFSEKCKLLPLSIPGLNGKIWTENPSVGGSINQAVKRNNKRFQEDFMFRLDSIERLTMRSQIVTAFQNKR
jgi:hypothetical protein